jgi:hypothetical protein
MDPRLIWPLDPDLTSECGSWSIYVGNNCQKPKITIIGEILLSKLINKWIPACLNAPPPSVPVPTHVARWLAKCDVDMVEFFYVQNNKAGFWHQNDNYKKR